jgi:hypothetical protein
MLTIRELTGKQEMMDSINVLNAIYPSLTVEEYDRELDQMIPHNYGQIAVFDDEICIGISGFWIGTKLWCGKYLEKVKANDCQNAVRFRSGSNPL